MESAGGPAYKGLDSTLRLLCRYVHRSGQLLLDAYRSYMRTATKYAHKKRGALKQTSNYTLLR
jgi:hypothetical protein